MLKEKSDLLKNECYYSLLIFTLILLFYIFTNIILNLIIYLFIFLCLGHILFEFVIFIYTTYIVLHYTKFLPLLRLLYYSFICLFTYLVCFSFLFVSFSFCLFYFTRFMFFTLRILLFSLVFSLYCTLYIYPYFQLYSFIYLQNLFNCIVNVNFICCIIDTI